MFGPFLMPHMPGAANSFKPAVTQVRRHSLQPFQSERAPLSVGIGAPSRTSR